MCGRFVSASKPERIAEYFGAAFDGTELPSSHNVAPTDDIYAVVAGADGSKRLQTFHWGLIPAWAKERKIGQRMINARAESLADKPAYKRLFRTHRCLIPMDGFYEWRAPGTAITASGGAAITGGRPTTKAGKPRKQPMYASRRDGEPLAVAGLWSAWRDPAGGRDDNEGLWLHSATVVTTDANAATRAVHDRMPAILPASAWSQWLDPANDDTESLRTLLVPAADDLLTLYQVGFDVNDVRNNGPELIEPQPTTDDDA